MRGARRRGARCGGRAPHQRLHQPDGSPSDEYHLLGELVARTSLTILLYRRHCAHLCGVDHHQLTFSGDVVRAKALMIDHLREIEAGLDLTETEESRASLADILQG